MTTIGFLGAVRSRLTAVGADLGLLRSIVETGPLRLAMTTDAKGGAA